MKPWIATIYIRWTARIASLASLGLLLLILFNEDFDPSKIRFREWMGLLFFPTGVCLGMLLAWRWEKVGGLITVGSLAAFYVEQCFVSGGLPDGWAFALFAAPGPLFLVADLLTHMQKKRSE